MATETAHKKTLAPVYICHGAEGDQCHVLSLKPGGESPWGTHQFSCQEIVGDPSSLIGVEPKRGEFQAFPMTGAALKLHCPANGQDRDMELRLISEFTAQPFGIALKLGHYRCVLADKSPPIGAPIVGQKVTASVTVESFYTRALATNIEVMWKVGGEEVAVPTNSSGVSEFTYTVAKAGKQTMTASLYNPYNDETITEEFSFTGYASSPWEQASLSVNGNAVKFGDPVVLIRGQANGVVVEAPPEIARQISLGLADAGGLTIEASPDFGSLVDPVAGKFTWRLTSGAGKSGNVALVLHSHEVELPWELRCAVMSANLADEVDKVLVNGVASPPAQIQFFRNDPQTLTLTYKAGSPLQGIPLQLVGTPLTGVQPANLSVTPAGETATHSWTVKSHTNSGTFQLELKGPEGTTGIRLPVCKVMARYLSEEVQDVLVDGVAHSAEILFFRGAPKTVTLAYKANSPLSGYPLELKAIPVTGLQAGDLKVTPVSADPHKWTVEAANRSGTFRIELSGPEITRNLVLPDNKVLSPNLADELDAKMDGVLIPVGGVELTGGTARTLTLTPKTSSPVAGHPLMLRWVNGSDLVKADIASTPAFDTKTTTYSWSIQGALKNGTFVLDVSGDQFKTALTLPPFSLNSTNLDEFSASFDGRDILLDTQVPVYRGVEYSFELVLPKGSKLIGKKITPSWGTTGASLGVTLIPAIGSEVVLKERTEWKVRGGDIKDGLFSIKFAIPGVSQQLEVKFSLANHPIKIACLSTGDEPIVGQPMVFEAIVVFANAPDFPVKNASVVGVVLGIPLNFAVDNMGVARIPLILPSPKTYTLEVRAKVKPEDTPVTETCQFEAISDPVPSVLRSNTLLILDKQFGTFPVILRHLGSYALPKNFVGGMKIDLKGAGGVVSGKKVGVRISPRVPAPGFNPQLEVLRALTDYGLRWDFNNNNSLEKFTLEFYSPDFPDTHKMFFTFY